jgi:hypothetical protein
MKTAAAKHALKTTAAPQKKTTSECSALLLLANDSSMKREELRIAVMWEAARHAYSHGQLPEFWRLVAGKKSPTTCRATTPFDELLGHTDFPKRWKSVPAKSRASFVRSFGDQTSAAHLLSVHEGWRHAKCFGFWHDDWMSKINKDPSLLAEYNHHKGIAPKRLEMPDGGWVVMLRIYPYSGSNAVAQSLKEELEREGWPQDGRRNGKDMNEDQTILKGLAGLWLRDDQPVRTKRNSIIYPHRKGKGCERLAAAEGHAEARIAALAKALGKISADWDAAHTETSEDQARDDELLTLLSKHPK